MKKIKIKKNHKHFLGFFGSIFCPMKHNDFKPYILRHKILFFISFLSIILFTFSLVRYYYFHYSKIGGDAMNNIIIDLINNKRIEYNQNILNKNFELEELANEEARYFYKNIKKNNFIKEEINKKSFIMDKKIENFSFLYEKHLLFNNKYKDLDLVLSNLDINKDILDNRFDEIGISTKNIIINNQNLTLIIQIFGERDKNNIKRNNATALQTKNINFNNNFLKNEDFIKNNNIHYATFIQKTIYNFWYSLNIFYKSIITLIIISFIFFFFSEYKRRHFLHMFYGILTILLLITLLYFNQKII